MGAHTYTDAHTQVNKHVHIHTFMHKHIQCMHTHIYTHLTHMYTCTYTHTNFKHTECFISIFCTHSGHVHHPNSITKITLNILSINSLSAGQKTYTPVKQSKMPFPSINNELIIFKLVNSFTMRALGPC